MCRSCAICSFFHTHTCYLQGTAHDMIASACTSMYCSSLAYTLKDFKYVLIFLSSAGQKNGGFWAPREPRGAHVWISDTLLCSLFGAQKHLFLGDLGVL